MASKKVKFYLILRVTSTKTQVLNKNLKSLFSFTDPFNSANPVRINWNLPAYPYFEKDWPEYIATTSLITDRVDRQKDAIIPLGYYGIPHPYLRTDEINGEIEPGILIKKQKKQSGPRILLPLEADFRRMETKEAYLAHGFQYIGSPCAGYNVPLSRMKLPSFSGNLDCFQHYLVFANPSLLLDREPKKLCSSFKKNRQKSIILMITVTDRLQSPEKYTYPFRDLLELLLTKTSSEFHLLHDSEFSSDLKENSRLALSNPYPFDYRTKFSASAAKGSRTFKNKAVEYSFAEEAPKQPPASTTRLPLKDRQTNASMHGYISLSSDQITIDFYQGKMRCLKKDGVQTVEELTQSYLQTNLRKIAFSPANSYSIESPHAWGLRTHQLIENSTQISGKIISDYFFLEDQPFLFLTACLQYPVLPAGEYILSSAPCEIPLFNFKAGEEIKAHCFYRDTKPFPVLVQETPTELYGNFFFIQKGKSGLILGFPKTSAYDVHTLNLCLKHDRHSTTLAVNPFGSYNPAQAVCDSGKIEVANIYIGLSCSLPASIPEFSRMVLKEFPRSFRRNLPSAVY